jgi:hypothetical protein
LLLLILLLRISATGLQIGSRGSGGGLLRERHFEFEVWHKKRKDNKMETKGLNTKVLLR